MNCDRNRIEQVLTSGPGASIWSERYEVVVSALVDAGKCWAHGNVPAADVTIWRQTLEESVRAYLSHPGPDLRELALRTLAVYWGIPRYEAVARALVRDDPDPDVRAAALDAWSSYQRGTENPDSVRAYAQLLRDRAQPTVIRTAAYSGLLRITGHLDALSPKDASKLVDVYDNVDQKVDWALVNRLAPHDASTTV